jgi:peptidoglycan hydrolase CwlO-like protein
MKNPTRALVFLLASLGMGITMPSCPGQEAMQQQIDSLTAKNADLTKKVAAMSATVDTSNKELNDIKQLLGQLGPALDAQKTYITSLSTQIQDVQAKLAAQAQAAAKKPSKRRK